MTIDRGNVLDFSIYVFFSNKFWWSSLYQKKKKEKPKTWVPVDEIKGIYIRRWY